MAEGELALVALPQPSSGGADEGDVQPTNRYHAEQCAYWREHWAPFDAASGCTEGCLGGCVPCWRPRLDSSAEGEPVGSC